MNGADSTAGCIHWYALILAGGSGTRMGNAGNKVLMAVGGESMLCRSVRAFKPYMEGIVVVIRHGDREEAVRQLRQAGLADRLILTDGGETRQASVANGLKVLPAACTHVAVHDGARCLVDDDTIRRAMEAAQECGAAVASIPCVDTIKQVDADGFVIDTPDRSSLRAVQTPQCFRLPVLLEAHRKAEEEGYFGTDDASLAEHMGIRVKLTEGSRSNIKLTTREDLGMAANILNLKQTAGFPSIRVGHGYDVHRLTEGRDLILCGVKVPHTLGLLGHSDADVAVHALMDAMLGAMALGDIGHHFPDTDEQYRGISSMKLLEHVKSLLAEKGVRVANADVTIAAQKPKLAPYVKEMQDNIARALELPADRVNIKATTTEKLGFEGEEKGISAQAVVLVCEV